MNTAPPPEGSRKDPPKKPQKAQKDPPGLLGSFTYALYYVLSFLMVVLVIDMFTLDVLKQSGFFSPFFAKLKAI